MFAITGLGKTLVVIELRNERDLDFLLWKNKTKNILVFFFQDFVVGGSLFINFMTLISSLKESCRIPSLIQQNHFSVLPHSLPPSLSLVGGQGD